MANSYLSTRPTKWPTTGASLSAALQLCDGLHSLEAAAKLCIANRHYSIEKKLLKLNQLLEKLHKFFHGYDEGQRNGTLAPSTLRLFINGHIAQLQKAVTLME